MCVSKSKHRATGQLASFGISKSFACPRPRKVLPRIFVQNAGRSSCGTRSFRPRSVSPPNSARHADASVWEHSVARCCGRCRRRGPWRSCGGRWRRSRRVRLGCAGAFGVGTLFTPRLRGKPQRKVPCFCFGGRSYFDACLEVRPSGLYMGAWKYKCRTRQSHDHNYLEAYWQIKTLVARAIDWMWVMGAFLLVSLETTQNGFFSHLVYIYIYIYTHTHVSTSMLSPSIIYG